MQIVTSYRVYRRNGCRVGVRRFLGNEQGRNRGPYLGCLHGRHNSERVGLGNGRNKDSKGSNKEIRGWNVKHDQYRARPV